ncbi:unnamed protein product [Ranitomeya imitator]|uniref:RNase H type-1 domain-containing protein n=1 Tax=Ranitomeya imitator TaxID=111125 RepID=A0ABN9LVI8_9NEOB|nr:unnamed protein product [Ranitomeya imitator]
MKQELTLARTSGAVGATRRCGLLGPLRCGNPVTVTLKELFRIIVAIEIWGQVLKNRRMRFWSNNLAVVNAVNSLSSFSLPVLALLQHLVLRCLQLDIWFRVRHVSDVDNKVADASSHSQMELFWELHPWAEGTGFSCQTTCGSS